MPSEITFPDPSGYTETPWTDPNGKQWVADSKGRWSAYKSDTGGGSGAWDDITGKPAAITGTTASFTTALESKLAGIEAGATGDQDLSGLLTISTAASTYAPISTTVTLAGTQTITGAKTFGSLSTNGTVIFGSGTTFFAGSSAATSARIALGTNEAANITTGNIARARIDNALSANAAPIVATTVTASGVVSGSSLHINTNGRLTYSASGFRSGPTLTSNSASAFAYHTAYGMVDSGFLSGFGNIGFANYGFTNSISQGITWTSGATVGLGSLDTGIFRKAGSAGTLQLGTGAIGSTSGSLELANLTASGTVTASGAVSGTTGSFSSTVGATRFNAATFGDANGIAFTSGFGVVRYTGGGTNRFYFGSSDDSTIRRSSAGVLDIDSGTNDAFRDLRLRNLTASGTVTAARYIEGVTALGTVVSSSTITITGGSSVTATLTASTACTFTMPTAAAGLSFVLHLKQAATTGNGSATFTGVVWPGGTAPTITATAGKMDILSFVAGPNAAGSGYVWYGSAIQNLTPP